MLNQKNADFFRKHGFFAWYYFSVPPTNTPNTSVPPPAPVEQPRKKWPYIIGGVVLILIAVVFVVTHSGSPSPDQPITTESGATSFVVTPAEPPSSDRPITTEPGATSPVPTTATGEFSNPEPITIQGYSGPQEDANISPDGEYLFFDSHNDAGLPTYIYMATRIDYKTFKFAGRAPGVNFEALEGGEDSAHNFYMVSPVLLGKGGATTIGHGTFSDGAVTGVAPLSGISPKPAPSGNKGITFDIFITPDGNTLYFSDFVVNAKFKPQGAQLAMAKKNADGSFTRLSNSDEILKNVNGLGSLVYNAAPSADGLALAFSAAPSYGPLPKIYIARRSSTSAPFDKPELVDAAEQVGKGTLSEPGSFSSDGKYLYFHRVLDDKSSQLYVLTRN